MPAYYLILKSSSLVHRSLQILSLDYFTKANNWCCRGTSNLPNLINFSASAFQEEKIPAYPKNPQILDVNPINLWQWSKFLLKKAHPPTERNPRGTRQRFGFPRAIGEPGVDHISAIVALPSQSWNTKQKSDIRWLLYTSTAKCKSFLWLTLELLCSWAQF